MFQHFFEDSISDKGSVEKFRTMESIVFHYLKLKYRPYVIRGENCYSENGGSLGMRFTSLVRIQAC